MKQKIKNYIFRFSLFFFIAGLLGVALPANAANEVIGIFGASSVEACSLSSSEMSSSGANDCPKLILNFNIIDSKTTSFSGVLKQVQRGGISNTDIQIEIASGQKFQQLALYFSADDAGTWDLSVLDSNNSDKVVSAVKTVKVDFSRQETSNPPNTGPIRRGNGAACPEGNTVCNSGYCAANPQAGDSPSTPDFTCQDPPHANGEACHGDDAFCASDYCGPNPEYNGPSSTVPMSVCQNNPNGAVGGTPCASNPYMCGVGLECDIVSKECRAPRVGSGPCTKDSDCPVGLTCNQNECGIATISSPVDKTYCASPSPYCNNDPNLCWQNNICLPKSQVCSTGICKTQSVEELIIMIIKLLLGFAGIIAVLILIVGGFWYITSAGNEEQVEKGKKAIINAIIGLVVVMLSYAIVTVITNTLMK